jgi:hypothetical protein
MSSEIGMTDASHRRVFSTETYSTRSITLDDDSKSEVGPAVNDNGKKTEYSPVIRLSVRKNKANYDVLTFNHGGENGDDDDNLFIEDDFEDNDFDALVGEFFWFLRNKENDQTPVKSSRTPHSGGVLTPRRGTSMMSHSSKGSYRPLVYSNAEEAFTPPVTPKARGSTYKSVPIQVIPVSKDIETETGLSSPVSVKLSEHGDENTNQGTPLLFEVVEQEESPYIRISLNETHHGEENVTDETSVLSYIIDNDETSKAPALSKRIEHYDVIAPNEVESRLDHFVTEETTSISSKHLSENNIKREAHEENVPDKASFFSDNVDSDGTSNASVLLQGIHHDDVVVSYKVESRFDNFDTQKTSTFSSKESIHDDDNRHLIENTQMSFVTQAVLQKNDPDINAYEKWVKRGLMPKMPLTEGKQVDPVLGSIVQENDQQSKAYSVWEKKGMKSPEPTPNKEAANNSSMTENHRHDHESKAYQMWKEKGLMSPVPTPNKTDEERAPGMKANDQRWKGTGQMSHAPTSSKAEHSERVASLIARSKKLLGKGTDVASSDKQGDPEGCLQDAPVKDPLRKSKDPSTEADDRKESSEDFVTSSKSFSEMEPRGTYSTLPQKSAAPGDRRVSFDAKFLPPLDTGEESVESISSISPSLKNSAGTKPLFAFADMPSQSSISHSISSASPSNSRLTFDSNCENKSRCILDSVPDGIPSDTEPRVIFDAQPTDSYSSKEPSISFDIVSAEFFSEKEPTPPPNSVSPRRHSTELNPLCMFGTLLTEFDTLLVKPSDQTKPRITFNLSSSDSMDGKEPTTTSETPSSIIDSSLAASAFGADPDGIIFDVPSTDSVNGKEPRRIFDDAVPDATSVLEPNSAVAFLIESPRDAEPTGIIFDGCSPDSANGKEPRLIINDFTQKSIIAPEQNGTTSFLIDLPSIAEPVGIMFDAPSPDPKDGKELIHNFDDVVKDRSRASDPNGSTTFLYRAPCDAEPAGILFDALSQDFANGKEPRLIIDDAASRGDAEPTGCMFDTLPVNGKEPKLIFTDTIPDPTDSSEPSAITISLCKTGISAGPTNSQGILPPDSSSDTLGTLVRESARGVEPKGNQGAHPLDSSIIAASNEGIATLAIESASDAAFSCTLDKTSSELLESITSSSTTCSIKSTYTKETSISIVSSTDSAVSAKGPSSTVVTVLVYSSTGTRISCSNSIYDAEEQRSIIRPRPSSPVRGRISSNLIIPHLDNPSNTSASSQIEPGLVAKRSCAFDSPRPKATSARDCTLGVSPTRLNIPSPLTSTANPSSISIALPTKPKSAEKRIGAFVSAQSEVMSEREPSSTLIYSPGSLTNPPHLTNREEPSNISIASPTKLDNVEKRSDSFDSSPVCDRKQSNATLANSTGEDESNLFTSSPKPSMKRSSGNFSSILSQWKEKSERNPNGHFWMSPSKDMTSPTTSKTPPSRIWSPPGKSKSTSSSRSSSSPSLTKAAEAPCIVTSPARFLTSSQPRTMDLPNAASSPTRSLSPSQSDEHNVTASAVSSITTNRSKTDDKPAVAGSSVFSKASMEKQSRTVDIPSVVITSTSYKAPSQEKTEDIPSVSSRAWTPSRHLKNEENMAQSPNIIDEPCSCSCESSGPFSGNDHLVEFFLPKLGMAHTCGKRDPPILIDSDPIALKHILRPWQVEFLKSVDIYRGDQLVKECNASAGTLAGAMRTWRLQNNLSSPKTISCGMALHIWSRTCKYYVRSIRRQMADGLVEVEPPTLAEVMSSFLDKDNGVSVPVERRMSLLTMGEPDSQREL